MKNVLLTVLSVIALGFILTGAFVPATLTAIIVVCILLIENQMYCVYTIHGVTYCGVEDDIPEGAENLVFFDKLEDAQEYAQEIQV